MLIRGGSLKGRRTFLFRSFLRLLLVNVTDLKVDCSRVSYLLAAFFLAHANLKLEMLKQRAPIQSFTESRKTQSTEIQF